MRRRRLARHVFTVCSAVSLLLYFLAIVLWMRGYAWTDRITFTWGTPKGPIVERTGEVLSGRGQISFAYVVGTGGRPASPVRWAREAPQTLLPLFRPSQTVAEQAGFRYVR